jgi:glycosyltransferase involved in cell wall biosynthesis
MKQAGFEVMMVSADGPSVLELKKTEEVEHVVIPYTRSISPLRDLLCLIYTIRLFWKVRPDIVHTHTPKAGLIGMIAARFTNVSLRVHTVAGLPVMTSTGVKKVILNLTDRMTYWGAHYILPNSQSMYCFLDKYIMKGSKKLNMIGHGSSNGIDLDKYSQLSLDPMVLDSIKDSIQYSSDCIYVIAIGRLVRDKGTIELIESMEMCRAELDLHNLKLILLGPIEEIRSEESLPSSVLNEIESNETIIHISWSDHVEYFLSIADLLVHASHREGFPNVLLQAGAMKCPIICSNIPGNVDIVEHEKFGLLFECGDSKDLAEKLKYALNNFSEISSYSILLQNRIRQFFSREFIQRKLLDFYRSRI